MKNRQDILAALEYIDPVPLDYQEWLNIGMGLKESGCSADDWDAWSRRDGQRYHPNECARKWSGFRGSDTPITGATIIQMAVDRGWRSTTRKTDGAEHEIGWEDIIGACESDGRIIDKNWIEEREVSEPDEWNPAEQLICYLKALFHENDKVGYVTRSFKKEDGGYGPTKGFFDRTAGELIQQLRKCGDDLGAVLGDYDSNAGAWIRFNPLDGIGIKNENVTDFRYALVESDTLPIGQQNAILHELELPIAALVHSGSKSLHAVVRIDADSYEEYRKRVDYLYQVCEKNGLALDKQNRNPSRLSRMPGVMRNGRKQFLVDTNIGKASWDEWHEWIEGVNDDLPDPEALAAVWDNLPALATPLIEGVLRQGHKMLLAGPSKAGKSFSLIELCICIAEGREWLGFLCTRGRVMYVNLELDRASCLHRFRDVYEALKIVPEHLNNIDIWNLRGKSVPMDKLAPKLIRRAAKKNYIAVVIDPIYKVITGDENSADQMAHFCNQFDKVCTELGTAVIYCHHHSKGEQGGKRSMDRASGSGVFARDPDALIDLMELEISDDLRKQIENKAVCAVCMDALAQAGKASEASQDDACSQRAMLDICEKNLPKQAYLPCVEAAKQAAAVRTAWRLEGTLREFPRFSARNMWFDFPVHRLDESGVLADIKAEKASPSWQKKGKKDKEPSRDRRQERLDALETAFEACDMEGKSEVSVKELIEYSGKTKNTVRNWIDEHPDFEREGGVVRRKAGGQK